MAKPPVRPGYLTRIASGFWNSIKPNWSRFTGRYGRDDTETRIVGQDMFGNQYYETAANPQKGRRRPRRWYTR